VEVKRKLAKRADSVLLSLGVEQASLLESVKALIISS